MLGGNIRMGITLKQTMVVVTGGILNGCIGIIVEFPPTNQVGASGGGGLNRTGGKTGGRGRPGVTHPVG